MIPRLQTEQELEDPYAADEAYLREVVAQASAPSPAPAPAPATPDWSQGNQVIDGLMYQPIYDDAGTLQEILRYTPGQIGAGQSYERLNPNTLQAAGTGQFKGVGNALDLALQAGQDLGPFVQFIPGVGQVFQAINAVGALKNGNIAQGIGTLAGLGGYTDIANAARFVDAVGNKDPLAALTAGMNLTGTQDIGGFTTKDITAANAVVKGLETGNYGQALSGAAQLTDSPNTAVAGAALSFYEAAKSGNPASMLKAGEALTGAINEQSRYYSKTDTGDETARLMARYGTADDAIIRQIEAMSPTDTAAPATTEDVDRAIYEDVLRQAGPVYTTTPTTEDVDRALSEDVRRMSVYDASSAKDLQSAGAAAQAAGYNTFTFGGGEYTVGAPVPTTEDVRRASLPDYSSSRTVNAAGEAARARGQSEFVYNGQVYRVAAPVQVTAAAGSGRGVSPGMTAAEAAKLPSVGAVAAPTPAPVGPMGEFYEGAGSPIAGAGPGAYLSSSQAAKDLASIKQLGSDIVQAVPAGVQLGGISGESMINRIGQIFSPAGATPESAMAAGVMPADKQAELESYLAGAPAEYAATQAGLSKERQAVLAPLSETGRNIATGVESGLTSVLGATLGATVGMPMVGAITLGVSKTANDTWQEGVDKGLDAEQNAKRTATMSTLELLGEMAGVKGMGTLLKGLPVTASAAEIVAAAKKLLPASFQEYVTEVGTAVSQDVADRFKQLGGIKTDQPITAENVGQVVKDTIVQTTAAILTTGGLGTAGRGVNSAITSAKDAYLNRPQYTPVEFLGSTPATQIVPTEGIPQQLTYQPPAPPPSQVQITGPEAAAPAPEIFGPESQLGFEEGVRPTAQQQLEEALSGVYEPPAPPAPPPSVPSDTTGITPEMVAFIDEDGGIVTYGDLGFTAPSPAPAPTTVSQAATQAEPATEAIFAEPQMDEINRLFQEVYQQQNYPVAVPATAPTAAPTTALTAAPAQQNVIDLAPALTTAAPAQDLSAYRKALDQAVFGGTGGEPATQAPAPSTPSAAPATGTILSTDPTQGTALVVDPSGNTKVVDVSPDSKPGDTVNINAPSQDLSTPVVTDPATGEVIRLGDVVPSTPAPSTTETKTQAPAPSQTAVTTAAPSPAPSTTETKTEAPAPTTQAPTPAPPPSQPPSQPPAQPPSQPPAQPPSQPPAQPPAPAPTPAPPPLGDDDDLPPVTEEELRKIVSGPTPAPPAPTPAPPAPTPAPPAPTPAPPAPTPAPPAPTPAPPAPTVKPPVVKPPSPAPSPAAQLAQVPGMTPELANFIQELMQTDEADLLQLTTALKAEREEKREGLRGKLKSRKA